MGTVTENVGSSASGSFIVQIQIAIVGIMIVLGAFFMWRMISSLDNRVTLIERSLGVGKPDQIARKYFSETVEENGEEDDPDYSEDDACSAEQMMKVFGGTNGLFGTNSGAAVIITSSSTFDDEQDEDEVTSPSPQRPPKPVHINDITDESVVATPVSVPTATSRREIPVHASEDAPSEADTDAGNPLSRIKLNKMKVEKLKDICADRGCSTEGTKQQLVERILGLIRD
jgi:hypothetical protein